MLFSFLSLIDASVDLFDIIHTIISFSYSTVSYHTVALTNICEFEQVMLTVRYRLNNRFRPIEADPELLAALAAPPPPPEPIVEVKPKVDESTGNDDQLLIGKIRRIEFVSIRRTERQIVIIFLI